MKVILLQDVRGHGKKSDVVNVSDGYAMNYLLPRKLAIEATNSALNVLEMKAKSDEFKRQQILHESEQLAKQLSDKKIVIRVKSGDNGKLFGTITTKEIAEEISRQLHIVIDKKKIHIDEPIRYLGLKSIVVKLHHNVTVNILVEVTN